MATKDILPWVAIGVAVVGFFLLKKKEEPSEPPAQPVDVIKIDSITINPEQPIVGDQVSASAIVTNYFSEAKNLFITMWLEPEHTPIHQGFIDLPVGEAITINSSSQKAIGSSGDHYLRVFLMDGVYTGEMYDDQSYNFNVL